MPASKAQRAVTAERRSKAIAMKLAGADYEHIATRLGYASRGAAYTDIDRAMQASVAEQDREASVLRQVEVARLDRLQAAFWPRALGGDTKAGELCLKIIDRRCKLVVGDAPTRLEVLSVDAVEREIARLAAELGEATPAEPAPGATAAAAGQDRPGGSPLPV